jgi:hypothetical protein
MKKLETLVFGAVDFEERITAKLLERAKRSGYFLDVISDAKEFQKDGFRWDVSLAKACEYWCS